jgi:hypothetical protein
MSEEQKFVQLVVRVTPTLKLIVSQCAEITGRSMESLVIESLKTSIKSGVWVSTEDLETHLSKVINDTKTIVEQPVPQPKGQE